jgi:hypothetical protein
MIKVPPTIAPFIVSSIMSSAEHGSFARHIVYGMVTDEKGNNIDGADILVESTVERKRTLSSRDGSFLTDIGISCSRDEILVVVSWGPKSCREKISAYFNPMALDLVLHDDEAA